MVVVSKPGYHDVTSHMTTMLYITWENVTNGLVDTEAIDKKLSLECTYTMP